jgi:glycosyltransferase involved in cell wall biosynthesis
MQMLRHCAIHVAPILRQDVRNQMLALAEAKLLRTAVTTFTYAEGGVLERVLRLADRRLGLDLARKSEARRVDQRIKSHSSSHLAGDVVKQIRFMVHGSAHRLRVLDGFLGSVDCEARRQIHPGVRLVLAGEDACLASFKQARRVHGLCLYDLPIAHYATARRIMACEEAEFPGAAIESELNAQEYRQHRNLRKDRELAAADHALVPSNFVSESLQAAGMRADAIVRIPYGCEPEQSRLAGTGKRTRSNLVLYVGHLSVRKGIPRLLRAWKRLGAYRSHRLRLIGVQKLQAKFLAAHAGTFEHVPFLPRSELWRHYAEASFFVFPSANDGYGQVLNEAFSCGVPVLASSNTGAPGFMTDGVEGLLYRFGDDEKLCAALDRLLTHPREVAQMGQAAHQLAQRWTWRDYRQAFLLMIGKLLARQSNGAA